MVKDTLIEICCGTIDDCLVANEFNVDRIELNSALELGGLTPSVATLRMAKEKVSLPICCMVRTRTSGFMYTENQLECMKQDAKILLDEGADGIVFGFLNKDHTIDKVHTKEMVELIHSYGKEAVFHKAFDECFDLNQASLDLIECGIDRVLTGGGKCSIEEGSKIVGNLHELYGNQLQYLIGGGVRITNICEIAKNAKSKQVHMTAKQVFYDDGDYVAVDRETLKKSLEALEKK